jgi:hypothetical protein
MWTCPRCQESIEEEWDVCWNCGTGSDGTADADFPEGSTDDHRPEQSSTLFGSLYLMHRVVGLFLFAITSALIPLLLREDLFSFQSQSWSNTNDESSGTPFSGPLMWIVVIVRSLAAWPILLLLWTVAARVLRRQLTWDSPSWTTNWFNFTRPLEFLHALMWWSVGSCIGLLLAFSVVGHPLRRMLLGACLSTISLWLTIQYTKRQHRCASDASPTQ